MTPHGVLIVDKPPGPTSHDIVAAARRFFGTRRVGHAGTLDPMASGVLVLLLGEATKLAPYLTLEDKEYRATVAFGRSTDTLDAEGRTTEERAVLPESVAPDLVRRALDGEAGRTTQDPPLFSAISVGGVRAHRASRRGQTVELAPRPVEVRRLALVEATPASVTVELGVSKGYYVRAFARDLGARLGVPAHLAALRRTASGTYRIEEAIPWPPIDPPMLVPLAVAAAKVLPTSRLAGEGALLAKQGKKLAPEHFDVEPDDPGVRAWLDGEGLVAVGIREAPGEYRVVRGFSTVDK